MYINLHMSIDPQNKLHIGPLTVLSYTHEATIAKIYQFIITSPSCTGTQILAGKYVLLHR